MNKVILNRETFIKLYELAYKDSATNCYNRNWLHKYCKQNDGREYWIGIADLNGLKKTNDEQGHRAGDKRIIELGDKLKPYGQVVRYGGDEFVIIFKNNNCVRLWQFISLTQTEYAYGIWKKSKDSTFEQAFEICDKIMYKNKRSKK